MTHAYSMIYNIGHCIPSWASSSNLFNGLFWKWGIITAQCFSEQVRSGWGRTGYYFAFLFHSSREFSIWMIALEFESSPQILFLSSKKTKERNKSCPVRVVTWADDSVPGSIQGGAGWGWDVNISWLGKETNFRLPGDYQLCSITQYDHLLVVNLWLIYG